MAAPPRTQDVLEFLTAHGFAIAASALRDDLLARAGDLDDESPPHLLPPLRTAPRPPPHSDPSSSSSSSSDAFLSIGSSSPSELRNPYGLRSPPSRSAASSSDRNSEFGTARDYNGFNIFSDTVWYDDQYSAYLNPTYLSDPYYLSEDKFAMPMEGEKNFSCAFPLCDCCGGEAASVYGRYRIMPDETEILDECGVGAYQMKLMDEPHDPNQEIEKKTSQLRIAEKELGMLHTNAFEEGTLTNSHPTCESKINERSNNHVKASFMTNVGNKESRKEDWNMQLVPEKASQTNVADCHGLGECGEVDKEHQVTGVAGFEGEDNGATDELQIHNFREDEYEIFDLRIIHRKNRTGFEENKDLPIILNSVIAGRYYVTKYLGSAAFSKVVQAHDLHTGVDVCLKIIKNDKDFFDQSLDEIKLLKFVNKHDPADVRHILRLYDYFYHQEHLFIVCELLRKNLYEFQKYTQDSGGEVYFTLHRIQAIARQCLEALEYLHHLRIIHCDLKPENILIKSYSRCEIKIIDLGSSCFQTDHLCLYVQSRSYRAPEVILCLPYDQKIDIWSLGCVLAELYTGEVLFSNDSLAMMLACMIGILGPIDMEMLEMGKETHKYFTDDYDLYHRNEETDQVEYLIPEKSSLPRHLQTADTEFVDFLSCLLQINPERRPTASQLLRHRWLSFSYQ